ncbi:efflux RND transporter periplasmic adaptor subunit [Acidipila sp. EB88]|uniref:efflux RND transporter periplasmic adaptor subunit n=1 Tax=Acidipila sp. EB88 TaxID=2305226 RepID=UPI001F17C27A|nr:efflux RND transporter periplasmic adaptor subunit [Acidipila sp. EB88]
MSAVQRGSISHVLSVAGQFQPYQVVEVHAKVSGYIRRINVDIGDRVHAGETLATLEVPELNAQYRGTQSEALRSQDQIAQAQHDVSRAEAQHAALQANYDRLVQAARAQPGLIAQQELDNACAQADASAAQVDSAQAGLAAARQGADAATADKERVGALQSYTTVTAPLNGVILWRYADTGALIQAGTSSDVQSLPLVKLSQSDLLRLRVPVPEDAVEYVHVGDSMQIRVDALGRSITGKIVRFTRDVSLDTRTMQTEVDVPNKDLSITPGMYANTYLQLAHRENILTIPLGAIQGDGATGTVRVLDATNRLATRNIHVGLRGSLLAEVVSGLQEGDRVVLGDASGNKDGKQVTPRLEHEPTSDIMHEEGGMIDPQAAQQASQPATDQSARKGSEN